MKFSKGIPPPHKYLYLYGIILIFVSAFLVIYPKWVVDDTYILFRYADNLANHSLLTWNVGADPIEGYTGIVLVLMLSLFIKIGVPPLLTTHIIGTVALILGGFALYLVLNELEVRDANRFVIVSLYFITPALYLHALSGLETVLFTTAVTISYYFLLSCLGARQPRSRGEITLFSTLLITSLIRPEGVALAGIAFFALVLGQRKEGALGATFARFAVCYLLPGGIYFCWRWNYYGALLPNAYYAKAYMGGIMNLDVLEEFGRFITSYLCIPSAVALAMLLSNLRLLTQNLSQVCRSKPNITLSFISALLFVLLVDLQYLRSNLIMGFWFRFFIPLYPLLLAWVGKLFDLGIIIVGKTNLPKTYLGPLLIILISVASIGQLTINTSQSLSQIREAKDVKQILEDEHIPAGLFLRDNIPPNETLIVFGDAGAIPYYSGLRTVDFGGLNDEFLTHIPGRHSMEARKAVIEYFYSHNAGAIALTTESWEETKRGSQVRSDILLDPRLQQYILARKYRSGTLRYYLFIYIRKDLLKR